MDYPLRSNCTDLPSIAVHHVLHRECYKRTSQATLAHNLYLCHDCSLSHFCNVRREINCDSYHV